MTIKREAQISLEATPFYHCYVRCVRRAFLCGEDFSTGFNYDHRKQWIVSRLKFLSYVYAIDICAYAVMSNHYHVVLHVDKKRALAWSREEVVERWMQLYKGDLLVDKWINDPESLDKATLTAVYDLIEIWRERLYNISWFMRGVNETVARMANAEENCKGRFWEGRYKSQALLDEAVLLSCMAYVDLNPVRAGMENDLTECDFTSIQQRLFDYAKYKARKTQSEKALMERVQEQRTLSEEMALDKLPQADLMPLCGSSRTPVNEALPFTREDYFQLVDETGRIIRSDKRGAIPTEVATIIQRFGINPDKWLEHIQFFNRRYGFCAGATQKMKSYAEIFQRKWGKGVAQSNRIYVALS